MKKVFIITTLACSMLTACENNAEKESEVSPTTEQTMSTDSSALMSADSAKAAEEKRVKDSADKAHGHSH